MNMTTDQETLAVVREEVAKLGAAERAKVRAFAGRIRCLLAEDPTYAGLAMAWVGAEMAAMEDAGFPAEVIRG